MVYSTAAPRRTHPKSGEVFSSTLKPIGKSVSFRGLDTDKEVIKDVVLEAASEEVADTVAVMGGEDWQMWIDALLEADVLADGAKTTTFTYGREDHPRHLLERFHRRSQEGSTRRSSVSATSSPRWAATRACRCSRRWWPIPMMPLYLSLLFKVMKEQGTHELHRAGRRPVPESLYGAEPRLDEEGRLRADYKELQPEVQSVSRSCGTR